VHMISVQIKWVSNYKNLNWIPVIGHPRDHTPIMRETNNHILEFCCRYNYFIYSGKNTLQSGDFAIKVIATVDLFCTIFITYFLYVSQLQTYKYLLSLVTWYWKIAESENIHTDFFTVSIHRPLIAPYYKRRTSLL